MVIDITLLAIYVGLFAGGFYCGAKYRTFRSMFGAAKDAAKKI